MTTKQILLQVAENLEPNARLWEVVEHLSDRMAIEEGLRSLELTEGVPPEEVRELIPQWLVEQ